jgi:hypothetical protein
MTRLTARQQAAKRQAELYRSLGWCKLLGPVRNAPTTALERFEARQRRYERERG